MDVFATVEQYEARYGDVDNTEMLEECLKSASVVIRAKLDAAGIDYSDPDEDFEYRLMDVCRAVANRLMPESNEGVMQGVTQMSNTAGPYSQSFTFGTSYGTAKLYQSELEELGIGSGRIGWAQLGGYDD